jgi:hypothetical protein
MNGMFSGSVYPVGELEVYDSVLDVNIVFCPECGETRFEIEDDADRNLIYFSHAASIIIGLKNEGLTEHNVLVTDFSHKEYL